MPVEQVLRPSPDRGKAKIERQPLRTRIAVWSIRIGLLVIVVGSWQLTSSLKLVNPLFIGSPATIIRQFFSQLDGNIVTQDLRATVTEMVIGLGIGAGLGFVVGWILTEFDTLEVAISPLLSALNSLPRIALAPLFILWFGLGMTSKIALSISLVFFVMLLNTIAGLSQHDADVDMLAASLGMSGWGKLKTFTLPSAMPSLTAGLELSIVYSFLGVITAELIGGSVGLGVALDQEATAFQTNAFFATLLILAITTTLLVQIVHILSARLTRWQKLENRTGTRANG